ncbi:MAG: alpha/beta fold hydrolase, partial [Nevskiales bacterium]
FTAAGHRAVAPDLFGFGKSDKPVEDATYTWDFHRNMLIGFVEKLGLQNITLVCQDWGGLLGLTLPMDMPGRFSRLIVMNTALGTGDVPLGKGFEDWRDYCASTHDLPVGGLFARSDPSLSQTELAAYDAPFPTADYKAGVRRFPQLVPATPDAPGAETSRRARDWWRNHWEGKSFMAIGMQDPVLGPPAMRALRKLIAGCPEPLEIEDGGHFVQERGERIAEAALAYFEAD